LTCLLITWMATKKPAEPAKKKVEEKAMDIEEVQWEYKWKEDDDEVHGPHDSKKMMDWQESGFFAAGILVRKVGTTEYRDSKRMDFELYV